MSRNTDAMTATEKTVAALAAIDETCAGWLRTVRAIDAVVTGIAEPMVAFAECAAALTAPLEVTQ